MWGKVQGGLYTLLNSVRFFFGSIEFEGWRQIIFQRSRLLGDQWSRATRIDDAFLGKPEGLHLPFLFGFVDPHLYIIRYVDT